MTASGGVVHRSACAVSACCPCVSVSFVHGALREVSTHWAFPSRLPLRERSPRASRCTFDTPCVLQGEEPEPLFSFGLLPRLSNPSTVRTFTSVTYVKHSMNPSCARVLPRLE